MAVRLFWPWQKWHRLLCNISSTDPLQTAWTRSQTAVDRLGFGMRWALLWIMETRTVQCSVWSYWWRHTSSITWWHDAESDCSSAAGPIQQRFEVSRERGLCTWSLSNDITTSKHVAAKNGNVKQKTTGGRRRRSLLNPQSLLQQRHTGATKRSAHPLRYRSPLQFQVDISLTVMMEESKLTNFQQRKLRETMMSMNI